MKSMSMDKQSQSLPNIHVLVDTISRMGIPSLVGQALIQPLPSPRDLLPMCPNTCNPCVRSKHRACPTRLVVDASDFAGLEHAHAEPMGMAPCTIFSRSRFIGFPPWRHVLLQPGEHLAVPEGAVGRLEEFPLVRPQQRGHHHQLFGAEPFPPPLSAAKRSSCATPAGWRT